MQLKLSTPADCRRKSGGKPPHSKKSHVTASWVRALLWLDRCGNAKPHCCENVRRTLLRHRDPLQRSTVSLPLKMAKLQLHTMTPFSIQWRMQKHFRKSDSRHKDIFRTDRWRARPGHVPEERTIRWQPYLRRSA